MKKQSEARTCLARSYWPKSRRDVSTSSMAITALPEPRAKGCKWSNGSGPQGSLPRSRSLPDFRLGVREVRRVLEFQARGSVAGESTAQISKDVAECPTGHIGRAVSIGTHQKLAAVVTK